MLNVVDKILIKLLNIKEKQILKRINYLIFDCEYEHVELRKHLEPLEEQARRLLKFRDTICSK